jgi:hypothetical protein
MAVIPIGVPVVTLDPGFEVTVVNGATATSALQTPPFSASQLFTLQPQAGGGDRTIVFQAIKNTISVLTADLEESSDGGVTFGVLQAALDFAATAVQKVQALVPGPIYRLNIKTLTGTSVTINAAAN